MSDRQWEISAYAALALALINAIVAATMIADKLA
jgi:hypothetical protein